MKQILTSAFLLLLWLLLTAVKADAQTITASTYTFSRSGFAPATLSSPTQLIGSNSDNIASAVTDIGFTFMFAGTAYTQFSVNENGLMTLGNTQISGTDFVNSLGSGTTIPKIAPYWDDLATGTNGKVVYQVSGTAPNRILYVNWNVTVPKNAAGAANATIQVQLSETSGIISFTYGTPAIAANANQYSIGIGNSATDFASVTPTSATAATCAYGTANNALTISPGQYNRYSFTPDAAAPTITYTALANTLLPDNRTLTATIGDAKTGVPISGSYVPRVYYKKNYNGTYLSAQGVLTAGTGTSGTWSFPIDHSLLGGVAPRDSIFYFITAQDQASWRSSANIASNPTGVNASDVNTIVTPPSTVSLYKILGAVLSGVKTVGTSGADYTSLTKPGGLFEDINDGKLTGNLTVNIITDLAGETTTKSLNTWISDAGGPYTVTINPVGARTVSGSIKLNATNGLIIDGLNDGTNSLALPGILFCYGASNNIITRTTINGAISFNDASGTFPVNCSNNNINNCIIDATGSAAAFYFGSWVSTPGVNNVINNNVIKNFGQYGIHLDRNYLHTTISNNDIFQTNAGNYSCGVYIYNPCGNTNIFNNKIHDLRSSGTSLGIETAGIYYRFGGATDVLNIYNNIIYIDAVTTNNLNGHKLFGLLMAGAGTSNIYYNSIYIGGTNVTSNYSAGIYRSGGTVNFKNNAVFNARSGSAPSQYYKNYGVCVLNTTNFTSDNNLIFAPGTNGVPGNVGIANIGQGSGTDYLTLADWRTATGKDLNSISGNPGFTSVSDLSPDVNNPDVFNLNNHGIPIAAIGTDINGNPRNTVNGTTDIGAYEFTPVSMPFTISGNAGAAGVVLTWNNGGIQTTTADSLGNYTITVISGWSGTITPSLTGYIFSPAYLTFTEVSSNYTAQNFTAVPFVIVNIKVFLQGAFSGGSMIPNLNSSGLIPLTSENAYPAAAFGYTAGTVSSIPDANIVDWILIELRSGLTAGTKVASKAGFIKNDGSVVDIDGTSPLTFNGVSSGNYYIAVHHRNHLAIISSAPAAINSAGALYDFTTAQTQAYGTDPMASLDGGVFGMISGDGNNDGNIDYENDIMTSWLPNFGLNGYYQADFNMNGSVDYNDVIVLWLLNFGLFSQLN